MLFIFNVFFPMYPMDGAKLIVCSLQLFCRASARTAASVLIWTSVPLAVLFVGSSLMGLRGGRGGMMSGVSAYMGIMCLMETWKIYQLLQSQQLHKHPLFELARSDTQTVEDSLGLSRRLNTVDRDDDVDAPRAPMGHGVQIAEIQPFSGPGHVLAVMAAPAVGTESAVSQALPHQDAKAGRAAWLARVERQATERTLHGCRPKETYERGVPGGMGP